MKIYCKIIKIFSSRVTVPISTKLMAHSILGWGRFNFLQIRIFQFLKKTRKCFSLLINVIKAFRKCFYWLGLFFRWVKEVYGPLVLKRIYEHIHVDILDLFTLGACTDISNTILRQCQTFTIFLLFKCWIFSLISLCSVFRFLFY